MANRHLLHKNKLNEFGAWLVLNGWKLQEPKGNFEVLRAVRAGRKRPLLVHAKQGARQHLSIDERDLPIYRTFFARRRKREYI